MLYCHILSARRRKFIGAKIVSNRIVDKIEIMPDVYLSLGLTDLETISGKKTLNTPELIRYAYIS